ncbi:Uncharacterised protein [Mycobacteroides abscessus subsp. abscessus]|nr:Uncharacterised protein [Mycobacteroides abscessus subsp. abscessus]
MINSSPRYVPWSPAPSIRSSCAIPSPLPRAATGSYSPGRVGNAPEWAGSFTTRSPASVPR